VFSVCAVHVFRVRFRRTCLHRRLSRPSVYRLVTGVLAVSTAVRFPLFFPVLFRRVFLLLSSARITLFPPLVPRVFFPQGHLRNSFSPPSWSRCGFASCVDLFP